MYRLTVAVDLDGVLAQYHSFKGPSFIEPPMDGAKEFLERLAADYDIIVYTARDYFLTKQWLEQWDLYQYIKDVNFCPLNGKTGKPVAVAYVDDRGVRFRGDFAQAIAEVHELAGPSKEKDTGKKGGEDA